MTYAIVRSQQDVAQALHAWGWRDMPADGRAM